MNLEKILKISQTNAGVWTTLPAVLAFEFENQRYLYNTVNPSSTSVIRWFKILDTDDNDPVLLLQNRTFGNDILPGGITYDNEPDIHQIFYVSEITGVTYR